MTTQCPQICNLKPTSDQLYCSIPWQNIVYNVVNLMPILDHGIEAPPHTSHCTPHIADCCCCSCCCEVTAGAWGWFSAALAMRMGGARAHQRSSPGRGVDAPRWRQGIWVIDVQTTLLPPRRVGSSPSPTFRSYVASFRGGDGVRSGIGWGLFGRLFGGEPLVLLGVGSCIKQSSEDGSATTAFLLGGWVHRGSTNPRGRWVELLQSRVSLLNQLARCREGCSAHAPTGFELLAELCECWLYSVHVAIGLVRVRKGFDQGLAVAEHQRRLPILVLI